MNVELTKLKNRSNMLASQHATLSDYYQRWALITDITLVSLSGALLFLSVAATEYVNAFICMIGLVDSENLLPFLSFMVFVVSLFEWRIGFKNNAQKHAQAVIGYARVKREIKKT